MQDVQHKLLVEERYNQVMNEDNRPKVGVAAMIKHNGCVLLGLRAGKRANGKWGFPGGHVEFAEHPIDAIVRETKEETNLDVIISDNWDLGWASNVFENSHYITLYIGCELTNQCWSTDVVRMEPDKFSEWKWFDINELPDNLMFDNMYELIRSNK